MNEHSRWNASMTNFKWTNQNSTRAAFPSPWFSNEYSDWGLYVELSWAEKTGGKRICRKLSGKKQIKFPIKVLVLWKVGLCRCAFYENWISSAKNKVWSEKWKSHKSVKHPWVNRFRVECYELQQWCSWVGLASEYIPGHLCACKTKVIPKLLTLLIISLATLLYSSQPEITK